MEKVCSRGGMLDWTTAASPVNSRTLWVDVSSAPRSQGRRRASREREHGPCRLTDFARPASSGRVAPRPVVSQEGGSLQDALRLEPGDGHSPRCCPLFGPKEFVL